MHAGAWHGRKRRARVTFAVAAQTGVGQLPPAVGMRPQTSATSDGPQPGDRNTGLFDGVTLDRPLSAVPTFFSNVYERITGVDDPRVGRSLSQLLLAGERLVQAGLRHAAQGQGLLAKGSSVLGKVLPVFSMATGAMQVWKGWNELQSHDDGLLSIIHSKNGRTGLMQVAAGALLLVPGVGGALAGSVTRIAAAANEMDVFSSLDWPTKPVDQQDANVLRFLHPFDRTPRIASDRDRTNGSEPKYDIVGSALHAVEQFIEG